MDTFSRQWFKKAFCNSYEGLNNFFSYPLVCQINSSYVLVLQNTSTADFYWFSSPVSHSLQLVWLRNCCKLSCKPSQVSAACLQFFLCQIHMKCWTFVSEWELTATALDKCENGIRNCQLQDILISIYNILHG